MVKLYTMEAVTVTLMVGLLAVRAAMELPKFSQMVLLYPGYYLHGGRYRDKDIISMIGGHFTSHMHNTASIRMSWALNKYGGRHALGTQQVNLSKHGKDSYTGKDGQQYIFRNTAFGPFLAERYGNPLVAKPNQLDHTKTMDPFTGKQGIVRLVSYHKSHASGHMGLWDCTNFIQSRDWTTESQIISVEFWEAPDSYCPPPSNSTVPVPHLEKATFSPENMAGLLHSQQVLHQEQRHHYRRRHHDMSRHHGNPSLSRHRGRRTEDHWPGR